MDKTKVMEGMGYVRVIENLTDAIRNAESYKKERVKQSGIFVVSGYGDDIPKIYVPDDLVDEFIDKIIESNKQDCEKVERKLKEL